MSQQQQPIDPLAELRKSLAVLAVDDVLALCYRFRTDPKRLRLYLDALRKRGGQRAALAASLVCFDLASRGNQTAQREFETLAETLRDFESRHAAASELIASNDYLTVLWPHCERALVSMDPRISPGSALVIDESEAIEIDLFGDDDLEELEDFEVIDSVDIEALHRQYTELCDRFFDRNPDPISPLGSRGFYADTRRDVERVEQFLLELDSLRFYVPAARSMLAMGQLFLAAHLRSKNFWGRANPRKKELVAAGLLNFLQLDQSVFFCAAHLTGRDAGDFAWDKVLQLLLDFFVWVSNHWTGLLGDAPQAYANLVRELPRLSKDRRLGNR